MDPLWTRGLANSVSSQADFHLARDVRGANVGGVQGMCSDIKCTSCAKLCIMCVFLLHDIVFYITFAAPTSTLPTSPLRQDAASDRPPDARAGSASGVAGAPGRGGAGARLRAAPGRPRTGARYLFLLCARAINQSSTQLSLILIDLLLDELIFYSELHK